MLMKKVILPGCILFLAMAGLAIAKSSGLLPTAVSPEPLTATYQQINAVFTGDWQQYGELFTNLQQFLFPRLFLLVIAIVPVIFFSTTLRSVQWSLIIVANRSTATIFLSA